MIDTRVGALRQPLLVAYVWSLPLLWPRLFTLPVLGKPVVAADLVFALLAAVVLLSPGALRGLRRDLVLAAALPLLALGLSTALTGAWASGVRELVRAGYSLSVLLLLAHLELSSSESRALSAAWFAAGCVVCAAGLGSFLGVHLLGWPMNPLAGATSPNLGPGVIRIDSTMNANALVPYVQVALAFGLAVAVARRRMTAWFRVGLAILAAATPLTYSRGIAGLGIQLARQAASSRSAFPRFWRLRRWVAVAAALLVAIAVITSVWAVTPIQVSGGSGGQPLEVHLNQRRSSYFVLHTAAVRMLADSPLAGVGPDRFGAHLTSYTTSGERTGSWAPIRAGIDWDPHSTWFGLGAETGFLGLGGWLVLLAWIYSTIRKQATTSAVAKSAQFALVGLAFNGLYVYLIHLKFLWAFLGLTLAMLASEDARRTSPASEGTGSG